ncbi:putative transposase [Burkholderia pseudomallei ABCPW 1]|nr:DUF4158 domain-containing protein [Burkholderia pseudomallei]KGW18102.1 putative transposase [Burkholderia pseudomallei MSHR4000]KGW80963.1 putative transposase [Burkholderia pseudomallei MSHR456]KGX23844.1 putative transposase [Burkholderia pseudomallei ABCPW 1]
MASDFSRTNRCGSEDSRGCHRTYCVSALAQVLASRELEACCTPLPDEVEWARRSTRGERPRLGLLVLLKVFQQLQLFRRYTAICTFLDGKPYYGSDANAIASRATHTASLTMD